MALELAKKDFADVKYGFEVKQQLEWLVSVQSLTSALSCIDAPETMDFLDAYFMMIVETLTIQDPRIIRAHERKCIDDSLSLSVEIVLRLLPSSRQFLPVLMRILNPLTEYYHGKRINFVTYPGFPTSRISHIRRFVELDGFSILLTHYFLDPTEFVWNSEYIIILLRGLIDGSSFIEEEIRSKWFNSVTGYISNMTEEALKKEPSDSLTAVLRLLALVQTSRGDKCLHLRRQHVYHLFLLTFSLRLIRLNSLVLRLLGWEQIQNVIKIAHVSQPKCDAYKVSGAGTDEVNGIYTATSTDDNGFYIYTKLPSRPQLLPMTLFRCTMESKSHWWFLSIVTPGMTPGTSRDIDYYHHPSTAAENHEPPSAGWVVDSSGITAVARAPAPTVARFGKDIIPEGATLDLYLHNYLRTWLGEHPEILDLAFASPHREVISRCGKLIAFMNESSVLSDDHLSSIWKTLVTSHDADIIDEMLSIVLKLLSTLSDLKLAEFVGMMLGSLDTEDSNRNANYAKVALLVEKIARTNFQEFVSKMSYDNGRKLLELVWTIYQDKAFTSLKCQAVVQDLLSNFFSLPCGRSMALQSALSCVEVLRGNDATPDDTISLNAVNTVKFLIAKSLTPDQLSELERVDFSQSIIGDLSKYVKNNRSRIGLGAITEEEYFAAISLRTQLLLKFYEKSESKLPIAAINSLWSIFKQHPLELDSLFAMLTSCLSRNVAASLLSSSTVLHVFKHYLCGPTMNWANGTEIAFQCFQGYFGFIETQSITGLPGDPGATEFLVLQTCGVDTLWRIVLDCAIDSVHNSAVKMIVKVYEDMMFSTGDAHIRLTDRIFEELSSYCQASSNSITDDLRARHAVNTLYSAILLARQSDEPAHARRNCLDDIRLNVQYRRITTYYSHVTEQEVHRADKSSGVSHLVSCHSLSTVKSLRRQIANLIGESNYKNVILEGSLQGVANWSLLCDHNIADGVEVECHTIFSMTKYTHTAGRHSLLDESFEGEDESTILGCIGEYVSHNKDLISILFNVFSRLDRVGANQQLWRLLMMIPTQKEMLDQAMAGKLDILNDTVAAISLPRNTYYLQIIAAILQPSAEFVNDFSLARAQAFRNLFLSGAGAVSVIQFYLFVKETQSAASKAACAVCLHILLHLLTPSNADDTRAVLSLRVTIEAHSTKLIEKLLATAGMAAGAWTDLNIVRNTLVLLSQLLESEEAAAFLVRNETSKALVVAVLRSESEPVRDMACDFAVQLGKTQPVVLQWLVDSLNDVSFEDQLCVHTFRAVSLLLPLLNSALVERHNLSTLAQSIAGRIQQYVRYARTQSVEKSRVVVEEYMKLLSVLLQLDSTASLLSETKVAELASVLLDSYLLPLPKGASAVAAETPLCSTSSAREVGFSLLWSLITQHGDVFLAAITKFSSMTNAAAAHTTRMWGMQPSFEAKADEISLLGLKNQGCTCYMNSLLQLLYLNVGFREAILDTPLRECHRTTIGHRSPESLVGCKLLFEWPNELWKTGEILTYDSTTNEHRVKYSETDIVSFEITRGRPRLESGKVRFAPVEGDLAVSEKEQAAYFVLEQLQRVFYYLKYSMRRYFDPRPFVEACKTLNMNFSVFQQNDASEFCDQLLDRINTATKGKHTGVDTWSNVITRSVFGGKFLYQKIPQDCSAYNTDRRSCGHWQSSRQESFLKIELIIRGKDNIQDSIADLVAGELMDGDNKINCEVCTQKKATVRRTCLDILPNTMIVHLKRFDLDFTTFETVKLNNRLAFDRTLNMMKYTRAGIEAEELLQAQKPGADSNHTAIEVADESAQGDVCKSPAKPLDPLDYEYELQGVLVHTGFAQGGHYYSYGKDSDSGKWFRLDDTDVSPFNPENIGAECFGGPDAAGGEDRVTNALMLVYTKLRPIVLEPESELAVPAAVTVSTTPSSSTAPLTSSTQTAGSPSVPSGDPIGRTAEASGGSRLVTGNEAFQHELKSVNFSFLLSRYLLDPALQSFLRKVLHWIANAKSSPSPKFAWMSKKLGASAVNFVFQFVFKYLFDVLLHSRERVGMAEWEDALRVCFAAVPDSSPLLLRTLMNIEKSDGVHCTWLTDYLQSCTDAVARSWFVQIIFGAVQTLGSTLDESDLLKRLDASDAQLAAVASNKLSESSISSAVSTGIKVDLLLMLLTRIVDKVFEVSLYLRNSDELFVLLREMASVPAIRKAMIELRIVSILILFLFPDLVADFLRDRLEDRLRRQRITSVPDYHILKISILELLAALVGAPQIKKVALVIDRNLYDYQLAPKAADAFTTIFKECSHGTEWMTAADVIAFKERTGTKISAQTAKLMIDKFGTREGRLGLSGFLQYFTDEAEYHPRDVWKDLASFGYKNDLSRSGVDSSNSTTALTTTQKLEFPPDCRKCLNNIQIYLVGMEVAEGATRALIQRMCVGNTLVSQLLLRQMLKSMSSLSVEWQYSRALERVMTLVKTVLEVDDGLVEARVKEVLLNPTIGFAPIVIDQMSNPLSCPANDYDKRALMKRYIGFIQDIYFIKEVSTAFSTLQDSHKVLNTIRGYLRLTPDAVMTENEEKVVANAVVRVRGAGASEVNGDYTYTGVIDGAGHFTRTSSFGDKIVSYSIYRCNVMQGGHQWFISIPAAGEDPGTSRDIDFYFATCASADYASPLLPPTHWSVSNTRNSIHPAPLVTILDKASVLAAAESQTDNAVEARRSTHDVGHSFGYEFDDVDSEDSYSRIRQQDRMMRDYYSTDH